MSIEWLGDDEFKVYVWGHMQPSGKRKHYSRRGHGGLRKAQEAERELYALRDKDAAALTPDQTVAEYADAFLAERQRLGAQPGTLTHYRNSLAKLKTLMGAAQMGDVTATMLRKAFGELAKTGLSGTTRHGIESDIKAMFTQAANDGLILRDPGRGVAKSQRDSAERMALSSKDARAFLAHIEGYAVALPALLMYCTGMRPQEMLALRPEDCGLEDEEPWVHICRTVIMQDGRPVISKVKTKRSDRILRIDRDLADDLLAHVEWLKGRPEEMGPHWKWEGTLFPATHPTPRLFTAGGLWTPNGFGHAWRAARRPHKRKERLKDWSHVMPYTMRHTYATQRLRDYPLEVVSRLLGHSSSAVTLQHYSHVLQGEVAAVVVSRP